MQGRVRGLLKVLSEQDEFVTIEHLAQRIGAGVRTIHRDLERLERSLSLRGVRLERRRGLGVRIVDPIPYDLYPALPQHTAQPDADGAQRPWLMLMYLSSLGRWAKLSELARVFFVSDSSVSSDLTQLETRLPPEVQIERQKGVGARVTGSERHIRLQFVTTCDAILPRSGPSFGTADDELSPPGATPRAAVSYLDRVMRAMGLHHPGTAIRQAIEAAEGVLGYRFAPRYAAMLYYYLFITQRRIPECGPMRRAETQPTSAAPLQPPALYGAAAQSMAECAFGDVDIGTLPAAELELLAQLLSATEPTDAPATDTAALTGTLATAVEAALERALGVLEAQERAWLHDDRSLNAYLRVVLAAAVRRIAFGFSGSAPPVLGGDPVAALLTEHCEDSCAVWLSPHLPPDAAVRRLLIQSEIQEASLAITARLQHTRGRRAPEIAVKVLCYEGLGMSRFVATLAREVLPPNARIDSRWESDRTSADALRNYDLIISTFALDAGSTPVVLIDTRISPDEIRAVIRSAAAGIGFLNGEGRPPRYEAGTDDSTGENGLPLSIIMDVVNDFFVARAATESELLECAVRAFGTATTDATRLRADFRRRESYGSVVFTDTGFRLLHCRSVGISKPCAGVVQIPGASALVLAAPPTAPATHTAVLSELVIALTDRPGFAQLLSHAPRGEIQSELLALFSRPL